jgi:RNA polymerase sigma factor (TIGR02999 family)
MDDITRALQAAENGASPDRELLALVYEQLRAEANRLMAGERAEHTLQPTALVHEAYLKLFGPRQIPWKNRAHFYAAAAEAMRRILIDHAKARGRQRRGGGKRPIPLSLADVADSWHVEEILSLDDAVRRLGERDLALAEVVRLRFYAGLSIEETAEALGVSPATVKRRWEYGRTWLFRELTKESRDEHASKPPAGMPESSPGEPP